MDTQKIIAIAEEMRLMTNEHADTEVTPEVNPKVLTDLLETKVDISPMSALMVLALQLRSPIREMAILDNEFVNEDYPVEPEDRWLHVSPGRIAYGWSYREGKDGDHVEVEFSHTNGPKDGNAGPHFGFPLDVVVERTPGLDNENYHHDECWCAHPTCAPVEEHDPECAFRRWTLDEMDKNGEVCDVPDCDCEFECNCEPQPDAFRIVAQDNNEFKSSEFLNRVKLLLV